MHRKWINILSLQFSSPFLTELVMNFKVSLSTYNDESNCNGKILSFWNGDIDCTTTNEDDQQITCDIKHNELQNQFTINLVYS